MSWHLVLLLATAASCTAPAAVVAPTGPAAPLAPAPPPASAAPAPAPPVDDAPASLVLLFAAGAQGNGSLTAMSREGVILDVDARVTLHEAPAAAARPSRGGFHDPSFLAIVSNLVREALTESGSERDIADLWGAKRAEWVADAAARVRPRLEAHGIALDGLELVTVRVSASIEAAMRRAGIVPAGTP